MGLFDGKTGLVMGVANERSIVQNVQNVQNGVRL